MSLDVTLYGHMTIDTIFEESKNYEFGGVANVWRTLKKNGFNGSIGIEPTYYGEAIIYIDKKESKRYSDAILNIKKFQPTITDSLINHIMYINEFETLELINNLEGFNIADTCKGRPLDYSLIENIDILLSSEEDVADISQVVNKFDGIFILHNSFGSKVAYKDNLFEFNIEKVLKLENINVLGAGDIFAGFLIKEIFEKRIFELNSKTVIFQHIIKIINNVHNSTSTYLKGINHGN